MIRLSLVAVVLAVGGVLAAPATPSQQAPQLTCKYGFRYVTKIVHGHKKRVKVCKKKPIPKPQTDLQLTLNATVEQVTVGNHVGYSVVVENAGPAIANDIILSVDLPPGEAEVTGSGGSVDPDCDVTKQQTSNHFECRFSELAPESDTESGISSYAVMRLLLEPDTPGDFSAAAKVTFGTQTVDPHPADNAVAKPLRVHAGPASADLDVSLAAAPTPASIPDGFTETLSVTNHGPTDATDVYVSLLLPQGATATRPFFDIESLLFGPGLCSYYPVTFESTSVFCFDSVDAGATEKTTITVMPSIRSPATVRTDAVVQAYTRDTDLANNRATLDTAIEPFDPAPGIDLRLGFDPVPTPAAGKPLIVPFRLTNLGLEDARSITVSATVEPQLSSLSFALSVAGPIECNPSLDSPVECKFAELPSDSRLTGALYADSAPAGSYTARVTVTSPDLAAPVTATTTFQVK